MPLRVIRALLLSHSALLLLFTQEAGAQDALSLPQINVTAPSPIVRHARPKPPADAVPVAPADVTMLGQLPIVSDQFATVTVIPTEEIKRSGGATLGDLLFSKPGITGSSFAPGASSRPVVRGLDMNRVRVQENGIGANGASDLGEDHGVPIDPLAARQIEVVRGPATLRYGSQAIGGVLNAENNRIPTFIPPGGHSAEISGAGTSADNGLEGSVLLDAGKGNYAIHADAYGRTAQDYRIPAYPYLPPASQSQPFNGKQPNSAMHSDGQSIGGSYIFNGGFVGAALSQFNSLYHVPGLDGASSNTRIDMKQTKLTSKGEFRPQTSAVDAIRFWAGYSDYKHNEIGLADITDPASDGVRQTFTNKEAEGRVEVQFAPLKLPFATLTTAAGVQAWHQDLTAPSPDNPGTLNGLFDPNATTSLAGYMFNEFRLSPTLRTQLAGRIEQSRVSGSAVNFPSNVFDISALSPSASQERTFAPKSASFGVLKDLPMDLVGSLTAQYVERAPRAPELFSRGAHDATVTFDVGNPNLSIEVAKSLEIGIKRAKGPFRFEANAYYTRFDGFIHRSLTGVMCGETSCGTPGEDELNQAVYSQRDAIFRGGEFQFQWDVLPMWHGTWGVDGQYDIVRATFTDGSNVPRIPPQRLGGGVYFRSAEWLARLSLLHAFAQNDIATVGETPTSGYNLLKAELSRTQQFKNSPTGIKQLTVGVVGNNLLDEQIRNHVSFTKDEVLMPGLGVRAFANVKY